MKKLLIIFAIALLSSCKEEAATPTAPIDDNFDTTTSTILKSGMLAGVGHSVTGTVTVYESGSAKTVVLDPFSSQNGPDLKVYLSKDQNASSYISLGILKSTTGKQSYVIPGNPDVTDYNYAMIWCEQFSVVFGRAEIKP